MYRKIFITDNCVRLHAQQFDFCYASFSRNVESAMNQTSSMAKFLYGEYYGLYVTNTKGSKEVLCNQGPFSSAAGQSTNYFDVLRPETIPGFEKCVSGTGKINFDRLLVITALMETTGYIISDDLNDISKYSLSSGCDASISIYSFWDLLIATIHHSKISMSQCLLAASSLKKEGFSRFPTKFWESDRKISNHCIFCGEDVIEYVGKFKRKN